MARGGVRPTAPSGSSESLPARPGAPFRVSRQPERWTWILRNDNTGAVEAVLAHFLPARVPGGMHEKDKGVDCRRFPVDTDRAFLGGARGKAAPRGQDRPNRHGPEDAGCRRREE